MCVDTLNRLEKITGKQIDFYQVDLCDKVALSKVFAKYRFEAVLHFAGLKSVNESVLEPLKYYRNNITSTLNLLEVMKVYGVMKLVFSSSATVYGTPELLPIYESARLEATSSYGKTKLFIEEILKDLCCAEKEWSVLSLRYFNPCGAHPSGLIGEDPKGVPANLMPYVAKVASGLLPHVNVYGTDYPTKDGTGVRDYIHICDIAHGHILALGHLQNDGFKGYDVFNLGTGVGYSVMDMIKAFSEVSGKKIRYEICSRRPGDVAAVYADSTKAKAVLKWEPKKGLQEMCQDLWRWQQMNPRGI